MWNIFDRSVSLIKLISDVVEKKRNHVLKEYDITASQTQILIALGLSKNGECSLKELEHYFCVAQSTMAGIVSRLEAKELVVAFSEPNDRRVKKIRVTSKGKLLLDKAQEKVADTEEWMTTNLNDSERKELVRLLNKVYDAIK